MSSETLTSPATTTDVKVVGRRVVATLVDLIIIGVVSFFFSSAFGESSSSGSSANFSVTGFPAVVLMASMFGYFWLMEGYLGRTVGKMVAHIQVVGEDGRSPGLKAAAIRTVLRLVDGFALYLVAFIAVVASPKNQRLGDMAAHTLVVRG